MTDEKDIYIKLMEDITGLNIEPDTPILQNRREVENATSKAMLLDDELKKSCDDLRSALGGVEMSVGGTIGYTEPCPISYTGSVVTGADKFKIVFIGLNPFLEGPRTFAPETTYADLANIHHPHDIIHETGKNYDKIHQYRRVLGCRENRTDWGAWSPFYKDVMRIYLALLPKGNDNLSDNIDWYSTWGDLQEKGMALARDAQLNLDVEYYKHKKNQKNFMASMALQQYLLEKLKIYPMASAELIPYKSRNFSVSKLTLLLKEKNKKNENIYDKYCSYFWDVFQFINYYTDEDAYIIITSNINDMDNLSDLLLQCNNMNCNKLFTFELHKSIKHEAKIDVPINLLKWITSKESYRKVVIIPSISGQSPYGQILRNIGTPNEGWLSKVIKEFAN